MEELISIIIPVYNNENTIERCLNSVRQQTYRNIEIVCVNDGSQDNSLSILKQFEQSDQRITVITKKNEGVSKARNEGMKNCSGIYLLFVDADDFISSNMIKDLYLAIKKGYDIAISGYTELNKARVTEIYDYKCCNTKKDFLLGCIQNTGGVVCSKMYRTSLIKENNLAFNEALTLSEDLIFALQAFLKADRLISIDKADYYYDRRNENISNANVIERFNQSLIVHDLIQKILDTEDIIEKQQILNKRLRSILYANLYMLVQNRDYASFVKLRQIAKVNMKNLTFNECDLLNKIWLKLYNKGHVELSYMMCWFRIALVRVMKGSREQ